MKYMTCAMIELEYDMMFDTTIISLYELENTLRGRQPFIYNALEKGIAA